MRPTPEVAASDVLSGKYPGAKALFLAGSVVRGEGTPESDLDLVVLFDSLEAARRESFRYQSWPVEAFVHDRETLRYFMEEVDRPAGVPSLADMVAQGIAVPGESDFSREIRQVAQDHLERGPKPWSNEDLERSRYSITDVLDDLSSPRSRDECIAAGTRLYPMLADHFFRRQGKWSAKGKSVPRRLAAVDPGFEQEFSGAFRALFIEGRSEPVRNLAGRLLEPDGGWLFEGHTLEAPPAWRIRPEKPR